VDLRTQLTDLARRSRAAARPLARASAAERTHALEALSTLIVERRDAIEHANAQDLAAARDAGLAAPMVDRLDLRGKRLDALARAVRDIAAQPDPVGLVTRTWTRPNGLEVARTRLPLGVILMIYESRPNVTIDAAALCIRSGNAAILRGGSEAARTNAALAQAVTAALDAAKLPRDAVQLVPTQAREAIDILVTLAEQIDLVIPRGGEKLIRRVVETSRIPVVQHYKGVCHVFVERTADDATAIAIVENSKVQRPGVCNALETLLVDAAVAKRFLPACAERLRARGVELRGDEPSRALVPEMRAATDADWDTEFLDLVLAVRVVDGLDAAIHHIDRHGTGHTATIVTRDDRAAARFTTEVDASCVLVNASTRFNDGGELGLGAEMGISTTRIHAYGPMGAEALTTEKFVVRGTGQVRT
jgi:glutamate-5-semialdehyde dehydrogenase